MRVSGKLILFISVVVALCAIVYLTTSTYQRGSYYYYGLGLLAYKTRNYEKAQVHFEKSYNAHQDNLMALYFLARSKVMQAEEMKSPKNEHLLRQAVNDCKELTKVAERRGHKNLYLFYYIKARAHLNLKEYNSAEEAIDKVIKIKAADYDIQVLYGRILIGQKKLNRAIDVLYDATKMKQVKVYEAYFYLAMAYEYTGQTDKAWYYYDQATKSWPTEEIKEEAVRRKLNVTRKP